jgi:hypothetical protein
MSRWNLSVRAYKRTLVVARPIADLDGASDVDAHHFAETLQCPLGEGQVRDSRSATVPEVARPISQ